MIQFKFMNRLREKLSKNKIEHREKVKTENESIEILEQAITKKSKFIRIGTALLAGLFISVNIVTPLYAAVNFSTKLGTNEALGSPLLNDNFSLEEWNKWEMVAFGVFLSNFTVPLVDSYKTAFTTNSMGSSGKGKKALVFGAGEDAATTKSLYQMLDYVVKNQSSSSGKPIKAVDGNSSSRDATINDLLSIGKNSTMQLMVEGDSQGQLEKIFDCGDGWDAQMLAAWLNSVRYSEYAGKAEENYNKLKSENTKLSFDAFGNICGLIDNEMIVIFPSAANSHIYDMPKYNLLNSLVLGNNYLDKSGSYINQNLEEIDSTNVVGLKSDKDSKNSIGKTFVYFDSGEMKTGPDVIKLLNSRLDKHTSDTFPIRVSVVGNVDGGASLFESWMGKEVALTEDCIDIAKKAAEMDVVAGREVLYKMNTEKGDAPIFGSSVYVPVKLTGGGDEFFLRAYANTSYKYMDGSSPANFGRLGLQSAAEWRARIMNCGDANSNKGAAYEMYYEGRNGGNKSDKPTKLVLNALWGEGNKYLGSSTNTDYLKKMANMDDITFADLDASGIKPGGNSMGALDPAKITNTATRVCKVYTKNEVMQSAMRVLGISPEADFSVWTPRIYLTYLNWFGILDGTNKFNTHLFSSSSDMLNRTAEELFTGIYLSEEEKKAEITDYTYLMLHPTEGREYRATVMKNWFTDWMYDTYKYIVGRDSTADGKVGGSRGASGFLTMPSYEDNFTTSWFIKGYSKYCIFILGVLLLAMIITGIIKQKKFAWFLVSMVVIVNIVLITPSVGEVTPYISNKIVQSMLKTKMTYWAMQESISNSKIEKEAIEDNEDSNGLTMNDYIRMLNMVYLDRTLLIKNDISKKVTEDTTGIINKVQSIASARWLLPTLIRQYSADDGGADYVYQALGDVYDNWSNMYWVYNPADKLKVKTVTSSSGKEVSSDSGVDISFTFFDSFIYDGRVDIDATSGIDSADKSDYMTYPVQSVSRFGEYSNTSGFPYHSVFYYLHNSSRNQGLLVPNYEAERGDWEQVFENASIAPDDSAVKDLLEIGAKASNYSPANGADRDFGNLWMSENPGVYFYFVVKDTFKDKDTVASLTGDLQGTIEDEKRTSFMHYRDTGYIRDVVDMEELFTNAIPYMYGLYLITNGTDDENGRCGSAKIDTYEMYKDMPLSWLVRSNWVIKLMEDSDLTRPCKIGYYTTDASGARKRETLEVENPMLSKLYQNGAEGRKMVFSEAEQMEAGLLDTDLSLVELKIIKINKAIEKDWTLLINYANTKDITMEVFYRQMATDALLEFNKELSPDRGFNNSKALYPTSLDLRNLSFDSIMKMLMVNSSRDVTNMYGDTMKNIIESSDMLSAILLLLAAFTGAVFVPFIRTIVLGILFYLGIWALMCNIFAENIVKTKIFIAYVINNIVYLIMNTVYYWVFSIMINTSTSDSVLSIDNIVVNGGPPVWQFIIVILLSLAYIYVSYRLIKFCILNFRDLGFEIYASYAKHLADGISEGLKGGVGSMMSKLRGSSNSYSYSDNSTTRSDSSSRVYNDSNDNNSQNDNSSNDTNTTIYNNSGNNDTKTSDNKGELDKDELAESSSGYTVEIDESKSAKTNFFDEQVEIGDRMEDDEKQGTMNEEQVSDDNKADS